MEPVSDIYSEASVETYQRVARNYGSLKGTRNVIYWCLDDDKQNCLWAHNESFAYIKKYVFDDHATLIVLREQCETVVCQVRDEHMSGFLYDLIVLGRLRKKWIHVNIPKIRSSKYGRDLCDITIVVAS